MKVEVVKVVEHEDGSATYTFDMGQDMADVCGGLGLKLLMFCGAAEISTNEVFDWLHEKVNANVKELTGGNDE